MSKKLIIPVIISIIASFIFSLALFDAFPSSYVYIGLGICLVFVLVWVLVDIAKESLKVFSICIIGLFMLAIVINMISARHILPSSLIQPSAQSIAENYIDAVLTDNLSQAIVLTNGSEACKQKMIESFYDLQESFNEDKKETLQDETSFQIRMDGFWEKNPEPIETFQITGYRSVDYSEAYLLTSLKMTYSPIGQRYTCGQKTLTDDQ